MCQNIKAQWQSRICTKELREPLDSYEILKARMNNPAMTLIEIAKKLNYDLPRVYDLSERYFHASRLKAFSEWQMQQLTPQLLANTYNNLKRSAQRDEEYNTILQNDEEITRMLQDTLKQTMQSGITPSSDEINNYNKQKQGYKDLRKTQSEIDEKYAKAVQIITGKEGTADGDNTTATDFIKALHDNRKERE